MFRAETLIGLHEGPCGAVKSFTQLSQGLMGEQICAAVTYLTADQRLNRVESCAFAASA